ncbi:MAG TPA: hypothetical protein VK599_00485, partial [Streptosporangiaceae bacterium]|nr:hypothetical protein [Streptosporangiaceae bacterium]
MSIPSRPSWAIVLSACAAALLGTALAATPARAADPAAPVVTITTPSTDFSLTVPPPGDVVLPWSTTVRGDADAEDVVIAADLSGISGFVDVPSGCPKDVCSLELGNLTSSVDFSSEVPLVTGSGATVGSTGTVVFSGTSSNGTVVGTTVKVTVTAGPAKLLTVQNKDIAGVKPGSSVHIPFSLANVGGVATPGATVQFNSTAGLTFPTGFSNCVSSPSTGAGEYDKTDEVNQLVCTFDTVLQPGRQYRLSSPLDLGVTDHALYEQVNQQA